MSSRVVIVGGHGKIAQRAAKLLSANHQVVSIIRDQSHAKDLTKLSSKITPLVLSLEDSPVAKFTEVFTGAKSVIFSAGAGGKGGPERTKKVDYEGALKIFDAIEAVQTSPKPHLILVSAIGTGDPNKVPEHYNEEDKKAAEQTRATIGTYLHYKTLADENLINRKSFPWTILRPTTLTDDPGTGKATIGRTNLRPAISRADVAEALALLVDRPDAAGLAIDMIGGDTTVSQGLDTFIKKGVTDWLG